MPSSILYIICIDNYMVISVGSRLFMPWADGVEEFMERDTYTLKPQNNIHNVQKLKTEWYGI